MNKKVVHKKLVAALSDTIKKLGLAKRTKKIDKLIDRAAGKLAARVESARKKEEKKPGKKAPVKKRSAKAKKSISKRSPGAAGPVAN